MIWFRGNGCLRSENPGAPGGIFSAPRMMGTAKEKDCAGGLSQTNHLTLMAKPKVIELALQGGGAHGAFTWGVLDRLLEDDRIESKGICGTSAGAMNAVVVADGLDTGARRAPGRPWRLSGAGVSKAGAFSPFKRTWLDRLLGRWTLDYSPGYIFFDPAPRLASPYELNPLNINPLREKLIESLVDFEHVRHAEGIKLFVAATNVRTGKLKIFQPPGDDRGHGAGLRLPAVHLPGGGDRRRGLLGRGLHGQSGSLSPGGGLPVPRHGDRADQPHLSPGTAPHARPIS
jgi:hypothetical protein